MMIHSRLPRGHQNSEVRIQINVSTAGELLRMNAPVRESEDGTWLAFSALTVLESLAKTSRMRDGATKTNEYSATTVKVGPKEQLVDLSA